MGALALGTRYRHNEAVKTPRSSVCCLVFALLGACGGSDAKLLAAGAMAPDMTGEQLDGQKVRLSEKRANYAVVFLYPKDETPGCTKEACAFRDAFDTYSQRGIEIFGVSRDDQASHRKFQEAHALPFALVADVDGKLQDAYGVGSRFGMSKRVTFLVAPGGKIARVWPEVDPAVHSKEVLSAVN